MNERIKLLAAHAGYPDGMIHGQYLVLDRFSELIVRETIDQVTNTMELPWHEMQELIKQHFGVEG